MLNTRPPHQVEEVNGIVLAPKLVPGVINQEIAGL